jgi:hypothetical protein
MCDRRGNGWNWRWGQPGRRLDSQRALPEIWTSMRYRELRLWRGAGSDRRRAFWRKLVIEGWPLVERAFRIWRPVSSTGSTMLIRFATAVDDCSVRSRRYRRDAAGRVVRVVGSNADETPQVEAETRLRNAIDGMEAASPISCR